MSRIIILLVLGCLLNSSLNAQNSLENILSQQHDSIAELELTEVSLLMTLPMGYASNQWQASLNLNKDRAIERIDLVYTAYHAPQYDQYALNQRRLRKLKAVCSSCFEKNVKWNVIAQKGCNSKADCKEYFHGFLIYYQNQPTVDEEISYLDEVFKELDFAKVTGKTDDFFRLGELDRAPSFSGGQVEERRYFNRNLKYPESAKERGKQGTVLILMSVNEKGEVIDAELMRGFDGECDQEALRLVNEMPSLNPGIIGEDFVNAKVKITIPFDLNKKRPNSEYIYYDTYWEEERREVHGKPKDPPFATGGSVIENDLFVKVFERNYRWDSMAVVVDLTGSMSPFTAQLLMWLYEDLIRQSNRVRHLSFFNDGDGMMDQLKIVGKTGGIYHLNEGNFSDLKATVRKTMRAGRGGDLPENNVEASLEAMKSCQNCGNFILVSDNLASPRDLALAKELKKPLRIIICGALGGVNPAYLDLAYKTKGSIHTADDDIKALWELEIGDELEFSGRTYILQEEGFNFKKEESEIEN